LIQANLDSDQFEQHRLTSQEIELILKEFSDADWARASKMAEFHSNNVPGVTGQDLLQVAIEKFLSQARCWPTNTHPLVVLSNALHSIAYNIRKKEARVINPNVQIESGDDEDLREIVEPGYETSMSNRLDAENMIRAIERQVQGDDEVELVLMAWADGLRGIEAAEASGLDTKKYDAARKRLDRKLAPLKELWSEQ
jgi:DNA-directed RNA polymerase specialized sigma24 family protein